MQNWYRITWFGLSLALLGLLLLWVDAAFFPSRAGFFDKLPLRAGSLPAILVSGLGVIATASGVLIGWRADQRNERESKLRLRELELKITQLEEQISDHSKEQGS